MRRKLIIMLLSMASYAWMWAVCWWLAHLANETWIALGQVFTIFIVSGILLLLWIYSEEIK